MMIIFNIIVMIESNVVVGASAQYQIIAMNRVFEYTSLPEEADDELPSDKTFKNLLVRFPRSYLGRMESRGGADGVHIFERKAGVDKILEQVLSRPAFVASMGKTLADLAPACKELKETDSWHRIISINTAYG